MVHVSEACVSTGLIITLYINTVVFLRSNWTMVYVSEACVSTGLISTLCINILVFFEVKWNHGPCFQSMCK